MPVVLTPSIPQYITVHLGPPDSNAQNVTLTFPQYIKNVYNEKNLDKNKTFLTLSKSIKYT